MIPYIENFYTQQEADEFFEFIKTQPFVRPPNPRNKTYRLKRLSFPGYSPPQSPSRAGRLFKSPSNYDVSRPAEDAPESYRKFAAKLSAYAGKEINYMSTIGYLPDDHMDFHQHEEDKKREDQTVWVLSLGAVHPVAVRPKGVKDKSQWEIIHPKHGSLYVLPSEYNLTHEHAVLYGNDYSYGGLRLAINTKHIPLAAVTLDDLNRRKELKPLCSVEGCFKPAFGIARPAHGIGINGRCVDHGGSECYITDHAPQIYSQREGKT